jgi:ribonuclease VapC
MSSETSADTLVIDTSALVAIFRSETDSGQLVERIASYRKRVLSATTWLEAAMVCESASKREGGGADLDALIRDLSIEVISFTPEQARLAFAAFKRFGKGRGSKARLNFGDCFAYALAQEMKAPLLFKGDDFARTDLQRP